LRLIGSRTFGASHRDPAPEPLLEVLTAHRAVAKCQLDAFAEYVAAAEAQGVENYPLYKWTKATIANPGEERKILEIFHALRGQPGGLCQGNCRRTGSRRMMFMARSSPVLEALMSLAFSHLGALVPARAVQRVKPRICHLGVPATQL
jgi:hypothetical protein